MTDSVVPSARARAGSAGLIPLALASISKEKRSGIAASFTGCTWLCGRSGRPACPGAAAPCGVERSIDARSLQGSLHSAVEVEAGDLRVART